MSHEFKIWPDQTMLCGVSCSWTSEKNLLLTWELAKNIFMITDIQQISLAFQWNVTDISLKYWQYFYTEISQVIFNRVTQPKSLWKIVPNMVWVNLEVLFALQLTDLSIVYLTYFHNNSLLHIWPASLKPCFWHIRKQRCRSAAR